MDKMRFILICIISSRYSIDHSWYSSFVKYYGNYGRYISCYAKIKRAWNQIEEYTKEHFPNIYDTLRGTFLIYAFNTLERRIR